MNIVDGDLSDVRGHDMLNIGYITGPMKGLVTKLVELERDISKERGDFILFALALREDAADRWDLLVSASWLDADSEASMRFMADKVSSKLTRDEIVSLSRIVLINKGEPALDSFRGFRMKGNIAEAKDVEVAGVFIKHAYVIASMPSEEKAVAM